MVQRHRDRAVMRTIAVPPALSRGGGMGTSWSNPDERGLDAFRECASSRRFSSWPHTILPDTPEHDIGEEHFRVALCVPLSGSAGIWGPSCLAAAKLAQVELNRQSGILGRPCDLILVDASSESTDLESTLIDYVDDRSVDALMGMHISSVRQRIVRAVGGRLPYVYNALYEGGERTPELFAIGETAPRQLRGSILWLGEYEGTRRWALVGNDYVWPRALHEIARSYIVASGGEVVDEQIVPFGIDDYSSQLDRLRRAKPDAVLISLVGQDAVEFNRSFASVGLARDVRRVSCAIEENQLLAIGADSTEGLHVALGYFATLDTDANWAFKERYYNYFGERAPTLNSIGQSNYEGLHFLATLMSRRQAGARRRSALPTKAPVPWSARGSVQMGKGVSVAPMYLARAEGLSFKVVAQI